MQPKALYMLVLALCLTVITQAQTQPAVHFSYDDTGNRILRQTLEVPCRKATAKEVKDSLAGSMISLFPNPTLATVNIEMVNKPEFESADILLYDHLGREIFRDKILGNKKTVDLTTYKAGTYMLKMRKGEAEKLWKIIKIE